MALIKIFESEGDTSKKDIERLCQAIIENEGFDVKEVNYKIRFEPSVEKETSILFTKRGRAVVD